MLDTQENTMRFMMPGSPVVGISDPVEHLTQFVIPVERWSDGTESL